MTGHNVIVTGAHGFLGRHVARLFSRRGHTVLGIGHGEWSQSEWQSWGLTEWKQADVTLTTLREYAETPSAIIHCAGGGSVHFAIENPIADFERTVETTAHVLEYIRTVAPSCRIVYPSSASVYGASERLPIQESFRATPISQYGVHKLMAELMVASYARQFGASAAIIRLFSVYGCGLRKQLLWDACRKFSERDTVFMGTGEEVRDWLHVEDAAELLFCAAEHATVECPTINGGCGEGTTVREVLTHLRNNAFPDVPLPTFSGTQRMGDPIRYVADIEGSRTWGWQPKHNWRDGMREYSSWWRSASL